MKLLYQAKSRNIDGSTGINFRELKENKLPNIKVPLTGRQVGNGSREMLDGMGMREILEN
jgi:hypothetical protein